MHQIQKGACSGLNVRLKREAKRSDMVTFSLLSPLLLLLPK